MEKMNINTIDRLSLKNIALMLNLEYEKIKPLKKIDIVHMINNGLTVDQELQFKQKKVKQKPKQVKLDDNELKLKQKESQKKYFKTDQGKASLAKAQKKYQNKKKQPTNK
jgi:hypothetical protein